MKTPLAAPTSVLAVFLQIWSLTMVLLGSALMYCCGSFAVIGGCPVPYIDNGNTVPRAGGFMPGDIAVIQCNSQYILMPKNARPVITCNKDGSWSAEQAELPTCAGMKPSDHLVSV